MRLLARVMRLLVWVIVATWLGRKIYGWIFGSSPKTVGARPDEAPRPLFRDPVCGTHVAAEVSYPLGQARELLHFCSAECREQYRHARRHEAGA
jgi:YHS domain-containing protein